MPGPNAPYTNLDQTQILQRVYNEADDKLRVDAQVVATIGTVECVIDAASGDNISIASQDGTKYLLINADGSINVKATDLDIRNLTFASDKVDVSGSSVVVSSMALPTGAATEAKQDVGNTSLSSIDGKLNTLGQKTKAGSVPVVLASDSDTLPISAVSLPLPTGAATEAKQDASNVLLTSLDGKLNTLGQKTKTGSVPVVLASDSDTLTINLPTNAATASNQTTTNNLLTSIDNKLPTLGSQLSANSLSVTFASDISSLDVNLEAFTSPNPDTVMTVGSVDGTKTGTKYGFVYNLKQQILASDDRDEQYTYADFGTKDQRITRVEYSSPTFVGFTVRRDFNYTLVSGSYRMDSSVWSIV